MASRGKDIEAAAAYVRLYVKGGEWKRSLDDAGKRLTAFGGQATGAALKLSAVAATISAPLIASVKSFVDLGSELQDTSDRIGIGVTALSELRFAADQTGSNIEDLEKAFRKAGISSAEEFQAIADEIATIDDPAQRTARAMEIFGRSGAKLVPLLSQGSEGIQAMRDQAVALGLSFDPKKVAAAESLGDAFAVVGKTVGALAFEIGSALEPTISSVIGYVALAAKGVKIWVAENNGAVVFVAEFAAGLLAASAALLAVGVGVATVGGTLIGLGAIIGAVTSGLAVVGAVITAILSPLGLAVALLGAVGAYAVYSSGVLASFGTTFNEIADVATQAWQGVVDALKAGDLELALEIACGGMEVIWLKLIDRMKISWQSIIDNIELGLAGLVRGGGKKLQEEMFAIQQRKREAGNGQIKQRQEEIKAAEERLKSRTNKAKNLPAIKPPEIPEFKGPKAFDAEGFNPKAFDAEVAAGWESLAKFLEDEALSQLDVESPLSKSKTTTQGGFFNPFAMRGIGADFGGGGGSPAERTARATEKTAKNTTEIKKGLPTVGP